MLFLLGMVPRGDYYLYSSAIWLAVLYVAVEGEEAPDEPPYD